jgi:hypothetical protein
VATVSVERGAVVTVTAEPDVSADLLRAWLHGPVVVLVAGQQGVVALHASVIAFDGCRIAVAGRTGAGKSTMTLGAQRVGARLVADDVAVIRIDDAGRPAVRPFGRPIHVARDTAAAVGIDLADAPPVPTAVDEFLLPGPASLDPEPLDVLVVLERSAELDRPARTPLRGVDAVAAVRTHTYRRDLVGPIWPQEWFAWQVGIARGLTVERLVRPERWCLDEVLTELLAIARL